MSPDRASQFSQRDLVAATVVVGLLCTLLPSCLMQSPGGGGRRNTCMSNQHNIALALLQYAERKHHFPGYANTVGTITSSYLVPLFPYMERNDVYQAWIKAEGPDAPPEACVFMNVLVCPSNPPPTTAGTPNAYVINAGQADPPDDVSPAMIEASGIATDLTAAEPVLISPQYVAAHDGASSTLLLSENLQSQSWTLNDAKRLYTGTTFLWWNDPPSDTRDYKINQGKTAPAKQRELVHCRPSSNHVGGVVVGFCDGHVRFIAEDIDYNVYKQLMTPNGADSGDNINQAMRESDY
jgi:prepilin-type processing-associated H-X9-DG protein